MRSFGSLSVKHSHLAVAFALALTLSLSAYAFGAQQPAVGRKKVPRLTTDDVIRPTLDQPTPETPAAKSEPTAKSEAAKSPEPSKSKEGQDKVDPEEASWRERIKAARERAKALERAAEEAELRVTQVRNEMGASGQSSQYRNSLAAELEQTGQKVVALRAQARAAADDLNKLLEYGREKRFTEGAEPKATSEDGKPNEQYYRAQFAKLTEELQTAERRIQLHENRVRDLNQRLLINSGTGDNFYNMQIQQERDQEQQKLEEARATRTKAQNSIYALMEEARRAGVPPGVFR